MMTRSRTPRQRRPYQPDRADIGLVNRAWKNATCDHYDGAACVSCGSAAILRALDERYVLVRRVGSR